MSESNGFHGDINAALLLNEEIKPHDFIFNDWLTTHSFNVIYAAEGVGKSYFALSLAHSIIKKKDFLDFKFSGKSRRVIYFDMENDPNLVLMRSKQIDKGMPGSFHGKDFSLVRMSNFENNRVPNLRTPPERNQYFKISEGYDVVIIDNYNATAFELQSHDNEITKWIDVEKVAEAMAARGQCLVLIHHENKMGEAAGSKRMLNKASTCVRFHKVFYELPSGKITGTKMHLHKNRTSEQDELHWFIKWHKTEDSMCWSVEGTDYIYLKVIQEFGLKKPEQVAKVLRIPSFEAYRLLNKSTQTILPTNNEQEEYYYGDEGTDQEDLF